MLRRISAIYDVTLQLCCEQRSLYRYFKDFSIFRFEQSPIAA